MRKFCSPLLLLLFIFSGPALLIAQDDCASAFVLNDLNNWCSDPGQFNNNSATLSNVLQPSCFPDVTHDVWFSFTAVATDLNVTLIGNTSGNAGSGGTLENPQFAIYSGTCGSLTELQCASDGFGSNITETFAGPLTVGETYFIRVDGRFGNTGSFRLCVNNFNAVADPSGDCPTGVILCDKSPFTVESLIGTGSLSNEFNSSICIATEFASAWYRWTCEDPGTLTFTITPTNPDDDIDFALFELPNGIDDCGNKLKIRCEAAGENVGEPFANWSVCTGPTGLSLNETDTDEAPGCNGGNNNFVAAVDMEAGKSYALIINNFSNTGNGFSIEFGGTGTFRGPTADFTAPTSVCQNDFITFTDASESIEGIQNWEWNFGVGATPSIIMGEGPHNVSYATPGTKSITLTITSESGCVITHIENVTVLEDPMVEAEIIADYCGPDESTGAVLLESTGTATPYTYDWNASGTFTNDSTLENLDVGTYTVEVVGNNGCSRQFTFDVPEGLSLEAGVDPVNPPTCNGDSDGSISISIEIANPPVSFDFGNGPQAGNVLDGIPAGTYDVTVIDGQGCEGDFTIEVTDFPPLELSINPVDISCFGETDGSISTTVVGGAGNYTYQWSNGGDTATIENLPEGTYFVTVTDENGCSAIASADIIEPEEITFTVDIIDVICAGDSSGVISVDAQGGTPPFQYSIDGVNFQPASSFPSLLAGNYTVYVRDSRNCILTLDVLVDEPIRLTVDAGPDQTVDLGFSANINAQIIPPLRPVTIAWTPAETLSCDDCTRPTATPFETTTYYISIVDETNCTDLDSITIFVRDVRPVYFPNAFSPNSDGTNDYFTGFSGPAARIIRTLKVFNRWGDMVFEGFDLPLGEPLSGWDGTFKGKELDPAVFAWFAEVEFIDNRVVLFEGDVTIIR